VSSGVPEGKAVPAQLMASVVLLWLEIRHSPQLSLIKMALLTPPEHLVSIPLSMAKREKKKKTKTNNEQQHATHKTNDRATRNKQYIQVLRKGKLFVLLLNIPTGSIRNSYHHLTRISIRYRMTLSYHLFTKWLKGVVYYRLQMSRTLLGSVVSSTSCINQGYILSFGQNVI
jgi:hypothetical protein